MVASVKNMVSETTAQLGSVNSQETSSDFDTRALDSRIHGCQETETFSPRDVVLWSARHSWATMSLDIPFGASRWVSIQYIVESEKWQLRSSGHHSSQRGFRPG